MQRRHDERYERHTRNHRDRDRDDNDGDKGTGGDNAEVVIGDVRPVDGTGTNPDHPEFGATGSALLRLAEANFADGIGEMVTDRPDARVISNTVFEQEGAEPNSAGASDFLWVWGQFLDHDLDLTRQGNTEPAHIPVPAGDPAFDPAGTGQVTLPFFRATPVAGTGTDETNPREFPNAITGFIDASMVYGSDAARAASLRTEGGRIILTSKATWRPMRTVASWRATSEPAKTRPCCHCKRCSRASTTGWSTNSPHAIHR